MDTVKSPSALVTSLQMNASVAYSPRTSAVVLRRSERIRARTVKQIDGEKTGRNTSSVHEKHQQKTGIEFTFQLPHKRKRSLREDDRDVSRDPTTFERQDRNGASKRQRQALTQISVGHGSTYTYAAQSFRFLDLPSELRGLVYQKYIDFSQPRILSDGRTTNMPALLSVSTRVRHEFAYELRSATALSCDVVDMNFAPIMRTIEQYFTPPCRELAYRKKRLLEVHLHSRCKIEENSLSEWVHEARNMVGHRRYHKESDRSGIQMYEYLDAPLRKWSSLDDWGDKEEKEEIESILDVYRPVT